MKGSVQATRQLYPFHNKASFYGEELLAPRSAPKLEERPLSAVRNCLFNIFTATLHIGGRSSICNLRMCHALVTGTHLSWHEYEYPRIMQSLWTKSAEEDPDKITLNAQETLVFYKKRVFLFLQTYKSSLVQHHNLNCTELWWWYMTHNIFFLTLFIVQFLMKCGILEASFASLFRHGPLRYSHSVTGLPKCCASSKIRWWTKSKKIRLGQWAS